MKLSDREWECSSCHTVHDRDINASINIRDMAFKNLKTNRVGHTQIKACGEDRSVKTTLRSRKLVGLKKLTGKLSVEYAKEKICRLNAN